MCTQGEAYQVLAAGQELRGGSQRLEPRHRLRRSADFSRCYREGRRVHARTCSVLFAPNRLGRARLGISASRRVGKAVTRNRLRRRVREIFRRCDRCALIGYDIVVHLKPEAAEASFHDMKDEIERLLGLAARSPSSRRARRR